MFGRVNRGHVVPLSLLSCALGAIGCLGSTPDPAANPPGVVKAPTGQSTSAAFGPAWSTEERQAARQAVLRGLTVTATPADFIGLGEVIFEPFIGRQELSTDRFMSLYSKKHPIAGEAVGERVEVHNSWLHRGPVVDIDGGDVRVRFETLRPMGPAKLSVGFDVWGPRFSETVYRHVTQTPPASPRRKFEIRYPLAQIIRQGYDITGVRDRGRGVVAFRIEMFDADRSAMHTEDGRMAFQCNPDCKADEPTFERLPTIVLGPFVDQVTTDSAIISFETDVITHAAVQVKSASGLVQLVRSSTVGRRHEILLDGLKAGTAYRYAALAVDGLSEVVDVPYGTFRTAEAAPKRVRFAVMSDSRSAPGGGGRYYNGVNRRVLEGLMQQAVLQDVDFVVFSGDLIDGYVTVPSEFRRQLRAWMESVAPFHMHVPIYELMGNHEIVGDAWSEGWMVDRPGALNSEALFAEAVVNPKNGPAAGEGKPTYAEAVYSFDFGSAHFAAVNSNHWHRNRFDREDHPGLPRGEREGTVSDAQLEWLAKGPRRRQGARSDAPVRLHPRTRVPGSAATCRTRCTTTGRFRRCSSGATASGRSWSKTVRSQRSSATNTTTAARASGRSSTRATKSQCGTSSPAARARRTMRRTSRCRGRRRSRRSSPTTTSC